LQIAADHRTSAGTVGDRRRVMTGGSGMGEDLERDAVVDLVWTPAIDTDPGSASSYDALQQPPPWPVLDQWSWWRQARPSAKRVAVLAGLSAAVALASTIAALGASHAERKVVRTVEAPVSASPDALGCPPRRTCRVTASAALGADTTDVHKAGFSDVVGFDVVDTGTSTVYGRFVSAGNRSAVLTIRGSCPAHGSSADGPRSGTMFGDLTTPHRLLTFDFYAVHARRGCATQVWVSYAVNPDTFGQAEIVGRYSLLVRRLAASADVRL
jgi:hypothetical protein